MNLSTTYEWDIIFIDGLHISTQVEKDVKNSLNHLSKHGIIVLHDCNPFLNEDSYTRVIEDYWGQMWNGTVWKAVYKKLIGWNPVPAESLHTSFTYVQGGVMLLSNSKFYWVDIWRIGFPTNSLL